MEKEQSLIFIPDISGFTRFVNSTEVDHSRHIISELLELIIDYNELGLEVAEIEGDAVLFFRENKTPTLDELVSQSEKMFLAFHSHLKAYESSRVCNCGACSSASGLSLKMIAHTGVIDFIEVKGNKKPYGSNLILAHRLLKNDIPGNEYLLFTNLTNDGLKSTGNDEWVRIEEGSAVDKDLGETKYRFISLTPLRSKIKEPEKIPPLAKTSNPIIARGKVRGEPAEVYQLMIDLGKRMTWNNQFKGIEYEKGKVNRAGITHVCILESGNVTFETLPGQFEDGKFEYGEKIITPPPMLKELAIYFLIDKVEDGSEITIEVHYKKKPVLGWLFEPIIRSRFQKNLGLSLTDLKHAFESRSDEILEEGIVEVKKSG